MKKLILAGAVLASACQPGQDIPDAASPAIPPTAGEQLTSSVLPPDLTIATAPPTTEPEPTTTTVVIEVSTTVRVATTRPRPTTTTPEPVTLDYGGWSIPTYIVMCESGGRWDAYNASGASGPYQLMPLHFNGELAMNQSREAQHAKAAQLWNGGKGKSHWSACL